MSSRRVSIAYGVTGQVLELYPPEGVPSSAASYSVFEGIEANDGTAEFTGTATADNVSTTVDAASGFSQTNRKKINLTATSNIAVGRYYLVENALGQKESVKVKAIASADYVLVEHDLAYDYSSGATFKGIRQYFTIDATFVATESKINDPDNPYRILWSYTVNSIPYRTWTYFDLVRQTKQHGVTIHTLKDFWPDLPWEEAQSQTGDRFEKQIAAGFSRVTFDLRAHGVHVQQVRDADMLDQLVADAAMMVIAWGGLMPHGYDGAEFRDRWEEIYRIDLEKARQKLLVDQGKEGAITREPVRQMFFKR